MDESKSNNSQITNDHGSLPKLKVSAVGFRFSKAIEGAMKISKTTRIFDDYQSSKIWENITDSLGLWNDMIWICIYSVIISSYLLIVYQIVYHTEWWIESSV